VPALLGFQGRRGSRLAPASNVAAYWSLSPLSAVTSILQIKNACSDIQRVWARLLRLAIRRRCRHCVSACVMRKRAGNETFNVHANGRARLESEPRRLDREPAGSVPAHCCHATIHAVGLSRRRRQSTHWYAHTLPRNTWATHLRSFPCFKPEKTNHSRAQKWMTSGA